MAFPSGSVWTFFAVPNTTTTPSATLPVPGLAGLPKRERP